MSSWDYTDYALFSSASYSKFLKYFRRTVEMWKTVKMWFTTKVIYTFYEEYSVREHRHQRTYDFFKFFILVDEATSVWNFNENIEKVLLWSVRNESRPSQVARFNSKLAVSPCCTLRNRVSLCSTALRTGKEMYGHRRLTLRFRVNWRQIIHCCVINYRNVYFITVSKSYYYNFDT